MAPSLLKNVKKRFLDLSIFFIETSFVNLFFFFLTEVMLSLPKHVDVHPMAVKKIYVLFRLNLAML